MSFTIEQLNAVTRIVVHDRCPDGLASAIVLLDAFGGRLTAKDIVFVDYGRADHASLEAEPGMLFCDMSPVLERADEFARAGTLVLDHHEPERVTPYGACGIYSDEPTMSGAMLAFTHVWMPFKGERSTAFDLLAQCKRAENLAILAGIRDTWQTKHSRWREACAQASGLMFWPRHQLLDDRRSFWGIDNQIREIGEVLIEKREEDARRFLAECHRFTSLKGRRVLVIATISTSDLAENLSRAFDLTPRPTEAPDVVIGFQYLVDRGHPKIKLSCRSVSDLLVLPFCKFHGGGGHVNGRAAGVTVPIRLTDPEPYLFIEQLWQTWEAAS